jgi:acyl-CoA reductase-like NAD-dependent aldehyde dehydrogenase
MSKLFPPGVINVIHGGLDVGEALTTHPLVRKISLTGGDKTAKAIMKSAADSLKRLHFELGGNDPAIILDDANLEEAVPGIIDLAFNRSGQVCVATKRVYIPEKLFDQATELFIKHMDQFTIGHGLNEKTTFGPVNNKMQYDYVKGLIERAKEQSKVVEVGQKLEPEDWDNGYYIQPAIVINARPGSEIVQVEQFGPILPLVSYSNEEDLLEYVNGTEYGLGSSVWTSDYERGLAFARKVEAGTTGINGGIDSPLGFNIVPFGGVKQSGFGWERGKAGLNEYVNFHGITYHKSK